jgi:hypothetical protein
MQIGTSGPTCGLTSVIGNVSGCSNRIVSNYFSLYLAVASAKRGTPATTLPRRGERGSGVNALMTVIKTERLFYLLQLQLCPRCTEQAADGAPKWMHDDQDSYTPNLPRILVLVAE